MGRRSPRRSKTRWPQALAGTLLGWAPLGIAALVFYQVTDLGLRPALDEELRLIEAQAELEERHRRAEAKGEELAALLRAQADPMYLERERRLLLAPIE